MKCSAYSGIFYQLIFWGNDEYQDIDNQTDAENYVYDAAGNRIAKMFNGDTTLYVRDASGNTLSVYTKQSAGPIEQAEVHLFGSSRLGIITLRTISPLIGRTIVHIDCHRPTICVCN